MVNKKRGFTLVELIIVIAVIGVLAAILIPVFADVIDKANLKSATSDARNTLSLYLTDKTDRDEPVQDALFFVEKANKMYLFGYTQSEGELVGSAANPYVTDEFMTRGDSGMESRVTAFVAKLAEEGHIAVTNETPKAESVTNLPVNTCVWSGYKLIMLDENMATETASVKVTISSEGTVPVACKDVTVYDADSDGTLTLNDALIVTHSNYYPNGAAGFVTENTQWGLSLKRLWGVENGGSYGYYLNNASAWSLSDPISNNDYIYAYSYVDAAGYSDSFSYFDQNYVETVEGSSVTLTLSYVGYDASWNMVVTPLANATITIDGTATEYLTDENGTVSIPMNTAGDYMVSATVSTPAITHLVPPMCKICVSE